eukprot:TRINITY_DN6198_c0_g1_i3.p2 TRINITY_DN6198_c0_g1~~TRINITY_DN6198_c0_g1_i3.p2  ORF type:complete len:362 (+),score=79.37 TRINITY_DN6198_c0_g1_i3:1247-2332(+)
MFPKFKNLKLIFKKKNYQSLLTRFPSINNQTTNKFKSSSFLIPKRFIQDSLSGKILGSNYLTRAKNGEFYWVLGYIAFGTTALSFMMTDLSTLREISVVSCFFGMWFNYLWVKPPQWLNIRWYAVLMSINLAHLGLSYYYENIHELDLDYQTMYDNFFKHKLSVRQFEAILSASELIEVDPGFVLAFQRKPVEEIYYIKEGTCTVDIIENGEITSITKLKENRVVGDFSFVRSKGKNSFVSASANVVAKTKMKLLKFDIKKLNELFQSQPVLSSAFYALICSELVKKMNEEPLYQIAGSNELSRFRTHLKNILQGHITKEDRFWVRIKLEKLKMREQKFFKEISHFGWTKEDWERGYQIPN